MNSTPSFYFNLKEKIFVWGGVNELLFFWGGVIFFKGGRVVVPSARTEKLNCKGEPYRFSD